MILCLDAGNSRLKWGVHDGRHWLTQGFCDYRQLDEFSPHQATRIIACNVAGATVAVAIEDLATRLGVPLQWFRGDTPVPGMHNGYTNPARLGADRWAALVGARACHAGAAVVVMAGTATTVDALALDGCFLGGLILPGIDLMRGTLATNTADLPDAQGRHAGFPTNTDDAIITGCIEATVGAVERMAARVRERVVGVDFSVFLSGGAAGLLAPHLTPAPVCVDNLVLEGLLRAATASALL